VILIPSRVSKIMDSITNLPTSELQASESYFPVMDPINLEDVVKNDLQRWSIRKRSEGYLPVHHDGPFPLSDLEPFSSVRARDSICLYKERMAKYHQVGSREHKPLKRLIKFDIPSFGVIAPSKTHLARELKAYRRKFTEKSCERARQELLDLEAELHVTSLLLQELRVKKPSQSESMSSNKPSLASRASDLSQKIAKKVAPNVRASILCSASEDKPAARPRVKSGVSWRSATKSKLADRVRALIEKLPPHKSKVINETPSPVTFKTMNWQNLSPTPSTESIGALYDRLQTREASRDSTSPSPKSKPRVGSAAVQRTERRQARYSGEQASREIRRAGSEHERPPGSDGETHLGCDLRRNSVADSLSVYSRALSG
jgi:hypothetical protein